MPRGVPRRDPCPRLRALRGLSCAGALLACIAACGEPPPPRPSLVLISASALAPEQLACYSGPPTAGAEICAIADRGVRFAWAFSPAAATAPAAASLLTSQAASAHGVRSSAATFLRSGSTTIASELARAGYATAAFIAVPDLNRSRNLQQGFDTYSAPPPTSPAAAAAAAADEAYRWLGARDAGGGAPFLVWIHFPDVASDAADPNALSLDALDRYVRMLVGRAEEVAGEPGVGIAFAALAGRAAARGGAPLALERARVPVLWRPPRGDAPQVATTPAPLLDLAPTFLAAAGVALPETFEGEVMRVGPVPPSAPTAVRAIALDDELEIGVIAAGRYYARGRDGENARTAVIESDGALPRAVPVDPFAPEVAEHELLLRLRNDFVRAPSAGVGTISDGEAARNAHSAGAEAAFPEIGNETPSR